MGNQFFFLLLHNMSNKNKLRTSHVSKYSFKKYSNLSNLHYFQNIQILSVQRNVFLKKNCSPY